MDTNDQLGLTSLSLAIGMVIIVAALTSAIWTTNAPDRRPTGRDGSPIRHRPLRARAIFR